MGVWVSWPNLADCVLAFVWCALAFWLLCATLLGMFLICVGVFQTYVWCGSVRVGPSSAQATFHFGQFHFDQGQAMSDLGHVSTFVKKITNIFSTRCHEPRPQFHEKTAKCQMQLCFLAHLEPTRMRWENGHMSLTSLKTREASVQKCNGVSLRPIERQRRNNGICDGRRKKTRQFGHPPTLRAQHFFGAQPLTLLRAPNPSLGPSPSLELPTNLRASVPSSPKKLPNSFFPHSVKNVGPNSVCSSWPTSVPPPFLPNAPQSNMCVCVFAPVGVPILRAPKIGFPKKKVQYQTHVGLAFSPCPLPLLFSFLFFVNFLPLLLFDLFLQFVSFFTFPLKKMFFSFFCPSVGPLDRWKFGFFSLYRRKCRSFFSLWGSSRGIVAPVQGHGPPKVRGVCPGGPVGRARKNNWS